MAYKDTLITARDQIASRIAEITAVKKPNYSVDGESYSWAEYLATLMDQLKEIETAIQRADGPWESRSYGV